MSMVAGQPGKNGSDRAGLVGRGSFGSLPSPPRPLMVASTALTVHLPGYIAWPADEPVYQGMLTDFGHLLAGTRLAPPPPPQQWRPPAAITSGRPLLQLTAERMS